MQIKLTSVFVDDQDKALKFYTDVLAFVKKMDFSTGKLQMAYSGLPRRTGRHATGSGDQQRLATRPQRRINKRFFGMGSPRQISLSEPSRRSTRG